MNDIVNITEDKSSISVIDSELSIPVTIIEQSIEAGVEQDVVSVERKDESININSVEETIGVSDIADVIQPSFAEVLINTTNTTIELPSDLEMPYAQQVDFVNDNVIYKGWADTGTTTSTPAWRIQKITFVGTDEDVVIEWADGNGNFDNVWDNRASLTYT